MKHYVFSLLFLLFSFNCLAQFSPSYNDAGMWNTVGFDFALNKKFAIVGAEELRIKENYSRLNLLYTNIGLEYTLNKYIKTSLVYRFINKYSDQDRFIYRHRLMWDATFKYKLKKWSLAYRHRLQIEYRSILSSELGLVPEWYSRNKFELAYQASKKIAPYISVELRYQLADQRNIASENQWHRIRYQAGFDYRLNKFSKVGVYYLMQRVWNVTNRENIYITGLEYSINLKDSPLFKKNNK